MKLTELSNIFRGAVAQGANKALADNSCLADRLTKSQAFLLYGRSNVERWLKEGLIVPINEKGKISKKCIERTTLERVARTSNRITYLPVADR